MRFPVSKAWIGAKHSEEKTIVWVWHNQLLCIPRQRCSSCKKGIPICCSPVNKVQRPFCRHFVFAGKMFSFYLGINMCAWLCGNAYICFKICSTNCRRQLPSATMYPVSPHLEMACLLPGQQLKCSLGLPLSSPAWPPQPPKFICPDPSSLASSSQPFCSSHTKLLETQ